MARMEPTRRDFRKEKPASEQVFRAYAGLYRYDKADLDAKVQEMGTSPYWRHEQVTFTAGYGGERMAVHVFLPRNAAPPFQAVVYFPGSDVADRFEPSWIDSYLDFLPKTGRALIFPIYKGIYERKDGLSYSGKPPGIWRDHMIMWSKDLGRTLDYLDTRSDIDSKSVAYFGFSVGAAQAPVFLAIDGRFKTAIIRSGGFSPINRLPECDPLNFIAHVRLPVLMLSDRYDSFYAAETSQVLFFRLLGTGDQDKDRVV